jgi:hypothetical protein
MGALALACSLGAQAATDLPVQQIIDRNIAARGGLAAWKAVKTLSMSGQMDAGTTLPDPAKSAQDIHHPSAPRKSFRPDIPANSSEATETKPITVPFLMDFKRPRMSRVELTVKGQSAIQVYDGKQGWKLRPFIGRHDVEPFSARELALAAGQQELDGPLVDYQARGTHVEKAGVEVLGGREAYKLTLTLKDGQVRNLWIDAQTFLDVQIDEASARGRRTQHIATVMSDYRDVQGLKIPFHLENHFEGVKTPQRLVIEQVSVNPPLADSLFSKPQ